MQNTTDIELGSIDCDKVCVEITCACMYHVSYKYEFCLPYAYKFLRDVIFTDDRNPGFSQFYF